MSKTLHISDTLTLPLEVAARTTAILAQKGAGKTYAAMRITEELIAHGQQVVALDPTGVWWGLRAKAAEKHGQSFDVIVLGGEHADAPLEPTAGAIVAAFAVESGRSLVLDLSGFESNAAQDRFATDFATALYRLKASNRATLAGYEVSGGGFNNALGKLRTLKLITGSRELSLAEDLR